MEENKFDSFKREFYKEHPEFTAFLSSRGRIIATTVLLVLVGVMGIKMFVAHKSTSVVDAANTFAKAKNVADLEKVVTDYGSTPTAPLAYMSLAKAYFDSGDFDMSLSTYMDFLSKFPDHPLATAAELNRTKCLEAKGQIEEAQSAYDSFISVHPKHYLADEALFGKARCLEQQKLWDQAKTIYEDYMVANPRGAWFPRAEDALKEIDRQLEVKDTAPKTSS